MRKCNIENNTDYQQAIDCFHDYIKHHRLRLTQERRQIVRAVYELESHFNVAGVVKQVGQNGGKTSRATVYRNIEHLIRAGLIRDVRCGLPGDEQVFEHIHSDEHHDHLTCIHCGKVLEFEEEAIEVLQQHVAQKYGFKLLQHNLDLRGVCRSCQEEKAKWINND